MLTEIEAEQLTPPCACTSFDAQRCYEIRYNVDSEDNENDDACECACHDNDDDWDGDEDYPGQFYGHR